MKTALFAAIAFFLLASSVLFAQIATLDTRGVPPSFPSVRIVGGTGESNAAAAKVLQLGFTVLTPRRLAVGEPFDFELAITNRSDEEVLLPQSLRWSDVEDSAEQGLRYQELDVSFALIADDGAQASVQCSLRLYGEEDKPATMVALPPGEELHILGTAKLTPFWVKPLSPNSPVRMQAYLAVNSTQLRPSGNSHGERFREAERQLYWARSENSVDLDLTVVQ